MCAASLVGTASAELTFSMTEDEILHISGDGSFEDVVEWFNEEIRPFVSFVTLDANTKIHLGTKGSESSTELPYCGTFQMLQGTTFTFDELLTLTHHPDTEGPVFYNGTWVPGDQTGNLTLDVSKEALDAWFKESPDHTHLMEFVLVDACMFNNTNGDVYCTFAGIQEEGTYEYGTEKFKNVGIITDEKLLEPGQIALLFRPQEGTEWGHGSFSLVAVGSQYKPVPEPATGTLSLVALAGLVARRRRK